MSRARFIAASAALSLAGCAAPKQDVERVLADHGYTDIAVGGYTPWGCGKDDSTSNTFTATGPTGRRVRGVVCGSVALWGKAYTVRVF